MFVLIFVPNKKIKQIIMKTLKFKNLELDHLTSRGQFRNWVLFFDEVSGDEPITFQVEFVTEFNFETRMAEPIALDPNSANAIRMFFTNTENAENVLQGFFLREGVAGLINTDWANWNVRETNKLHFV